MLSRRRRRRRAGGADASGAGSNVWRTVGFSVGVVVVVALIALGLWLLPPVLTETKEPLDDVDRLSAENRARDMLLKAVGGLVLLGGLFYTARTARLGTRTLELSQQTFAHSRQAQLAERFNGAIEQIGHETSRNAHIGGIMTLSAVAREDPSFVAPITEILTAFLREEAAKPDAKKGATTPASGDAAAPGGEAAPACGPDCRVKPQTDVQAAVTALGRRFRVTQDTGLAGEDPGRPEVELDLSDVDLHGVDLHGLDLRLANLPGADLRCAKAYEAQFQGADLRGAQLDNADLGNSRFNQADLTGAKLNRAKLGSVTLDDALLEDAEFMDLRDADGMTVEGATYNDYTWDHSPDYNLHAARAVNSEQNRPNAEICWATRETRLRELRSRSRAT